MYAQTRRLNNTHRNSASFTRYYGNNLTLGVLADSEHSEEESLFEYPFNELLVCNLFTFYIILDILTFLFKLYETFMYNFLF